MAPKTSKLINAIRKEGSIFEQRQIRSILNNFNIYRLNIILLLLVWALYQTILVSQKLYIFSPPSSSSLPEGEGRYYHDNNEKSFIASRTTSTTKIPIYASVFDNYCQNDDEPKGGIRQQLQRFTTFDTDLFLIIHGDTVCNITGWKILTENSAVKEEDDGNDNIISRSNRYDTNPEKSGRFLIHVDTREIARLEFLYSALSNGLLKHISKQYQYSSYKKSNSHNHKFLYTERSSKSIGGPRQKHEIEILHNKPFLQPKGPLFQLSLNNNNKYNMIPLYIDAIRVQLPEHCFFVLDTQHEVTMSNSHQWKKKWWWWWWEKKQSRSDHFAYSYVGCSFLSII